MLLSVTSFAMDMTASVLGTGRHIHTLDYEEYSSSSRRFEQASL